MSLAETNPEIHDALFVLLDALDAVRGNVRVSYLGPRGRMVHFAARAADVAALDRARMDLLAALESPETEAA